MGEGWPIQDPRPVHQGEGSMGKMLHSPPSFPPLPTGNFRREELGPRNEWEVRTRGQIFPEVSLGKDLVK